VHRYAPDFFGWQIMPDYEGTLSRLVSPGTCDGATDDESIAIRGAMWACRGPGGRYG
jgi:hypothetical protein